MTPPSSSDGSKPGSDPASEARLEGLLAKHLPAFRRFLGKRASRVVLDHESVDDLAQSVCRDIIDRIDRGKFELRTDEEFKQWLFEAGQLKLRARQRFYRAGKRDVKLRGPAVGPLDSEDPGVEPAVSTTPSQVVATEEAKAKVRKAIDSLDGRDAEVLRLSVLEGRSHAETAEMLGVEVPHLRVILSRAMVKLSRALRASGGDLTSNS
ncbi:MAG: sigma-70 family RNA polymerase sigma factor [Planctomycetota bacterium]